MRRHPTGDKAAVGMVVSLIVIALGAILTFAVTGGDDSGIDLDVVGIILMIVGLVGFILSLVYWQSWGGTGAFRRRTYVEGTDPYAARTYGGRRTRVVEEEDAGPPGPGPPPP